MQKHHLLLHSSFSLSPFKIALCCLLLETITNEVLEDSISAEIISYVISQINPNQTDCVLEKPLSRLKSEVRAKVSSLAKTPAEAQRLLNIADSLLSASIHTITSIDGLFMFLSTPLQNLRQRVAKL